MATRITLRDVAQRAGLTPAAASLALRRHHSIPESTRLRVMRAATELHYVPNAAARALRARSHRTVGVLLFGERSEEQLAYYSEVLLAVANEGMRRGFGTLILQIPPEAEADASANDAATAVSVRTAELLSQTPIDAAVCLGALRERQIASLAATGLPFAFIGRRLAGGKPVPHVATDYAAGARMAVEHLARLGHRRIALAMDPRDADLPYIPDRVVGYRDALQRLGLEAGEELLLDWHTPEDGAAPPAPQNAELVRRAGATAVFAVLYPTARRVLLDLHAAGVAVPDQVAVVGFSDNAGASSLLPPLTVVRQPLGALGAAAAQQLFEQLDGGAPTWPVVLPPALVVRRSCGAATTDTDV